MPNYIINKNAQSNGDHEVHEVASDCPHMPASENQIVLGWHSTCHGAVSEAKRRWPEHKIDGCYHCCNTCHTS